MGLINTAISNLLGGVSQQSKSLREGNNCEEQVNAYPSPVEGLMKRHGTEFMTQRLFNTETSSNYYDAGLNIDTSTHIINRDASERYLVTIRGSGNAISVWDLENNEEKTVYYDTDAVGYLSATDPTTAFSFATAGDVTYINNKEVTPKMTDAVTDGLRAEGIVHVRQGAYDTKYNIILNGETVREETPLTTTDNRIQTDYIAQELWKGLYGADSPETSYDNTISLGGDTKYTITDVTQGNPTFYSQGGNGQQFIAMRFQTNSWVGAIAVGTNLRNKEVKIDSVGSSGNNGLQGWLRHTANNIMTQDIRKDDVLFIHDHASDFSWIELKTTSANETFEDNVISIKQGKVHYRCGSGTAKFTVNWESNVDLPDFSFVRKDSTILITSDTGEDFTLTTSDSVGDTYLKSFFKETQYFSDLPASCYNGFTISVSGSVESDIDDYYIRFETTTGGTFGEGNWKEVGGFEQRNIIDSSTMPHILIRQADGTFLFKPADGKSLPANATSGFSLPIEETLSCSGVGAYTLNDIAYTVDGLVASSIIKAGSVLAIPDGSGGYHGSELIMEDAKADNTGTILLTTESTLGIFSDNEVMEIQVYPSYEPYRWENRKAGDDKTNPDPNFIGNPINDVFFYENRLGMLSGESVTLSESGQFFNFFRTTVIDLLDTAPIEVVGSSNSVNTLRHAISFNSNLLLFGDNTQFMLGSGREGMSPKTVGMRQVGNYECDPDCKPITLGTSVFFGYPRGEKGGLREMVVPDVEAVDLKAFDISEHVPSYIDTPFRMLTAMPQENLIIGVCKNRPLGSEFSLDADGLRFNSLYLYKYLDRANERIQAAWFRYDFSTRSDYNDRKEIIAAHVIENDIYIVSRHEQVDNSAGAIVYNRYILTKLTIENTTGTLKAAEKPLLDEMMSYDGAVSTDEELGVSAVSYADHETTFTLRVGGHSGQLDDAELGGILAYLKNPDGSVGDLLPLISHAAYSHHTVVVYAGDLRKASIWFGREYQMKYEYSSPALKGPAGVGGASELLTGRYQVNSANIAYSDSGNFDVSVAAQNGSTYSYPQNAVSSDTHEVAGVRIPDVVSGSGSLLDKLDLVDVYDYSGYRIRFQTMTGKEADHITDDAPNYYLTGSTNLTELGVLHVYVNVYGMTTAEQVAAEFVKAINGRTDLKVTARQCGVDIPFTQGELPSTGHDDYVEDSIGQTVTNTFILIQDVAGTAASTLTNGGLLIGGLGDNDPVEVVGWEFGVADGFADRPNPNPNATETGHIKIPIHSENSEYKMTVTSESPRPVKLLSTEFEAQYTARSRRMGG